MIKLSILLIALIAVFITSSTTFTIAHAQQTPHNLKSAIILGLIGTGFLTVSQLVPIISSAFSGSGTIYEHLNGSVINGLIGQ